MKALIWILFGLAAAAQWAVPLGAIWQHERVIKEGTLVRLKCRAPDPYDLLRGRYLAVAIEPASVPAPKDETIESGDRIYLMLETGPDGVAKVAGVRSKKPDSGLYIAARANSTYEAIYIQWPFDRYYLNEKLAPEADKWFAQVRNAEKPILAEVRVLDGRAVLVDLTQDGKPFREILRAMPEE